MDIPKNSSECAHDMKQGEVCSSPVVLRKMAEFAGVDGPAKQIVEAAKAKLDCDSESCVIESRKFANFAGGNLIQIAQEAFKPDGPANSTEWLSNTNIDNVLDQIARKYKQSGFLHIPFQMRDFDKKKMKDSDIARLKQRMAPQELEQMLMQNLANVDLAKKYREGYRRFGVVFNTDYSTGNGIHWFAVYGDMSGPVITLEYFNSSGEPPLDEIQIWLDTTRHKLQKELGKETKVVINTLKHQNDGHSCGPYALYYIMSRLSGVPYQTFHTRVIPDAKMVEFRKFLFRGA